jgi:hypothetical protein
LDVPVTPGAAAAVNRFFSRLGQGVAAQNANSAVEVIGLSTGGNTDGASGLTHGSIVIEASRNLTASMSTGAFGIHTVGIYGPQLLSLGVSTAGNTAGTTGVVASQYVLVGSQNVSLSQSVSGQSATVTILGPANLMSAGMSTNGNTAGTTGYASHRLNLVGSDGVTLSGSTNAGSMSISLLVKTDWASSNHSHGNPTLALTNITGTTASASNGLTLSLSGNAAQTVQTQNFVAIIGSGANGNGTFTSGTLSLKAGDGITLSTGANVVSIHAATTYAASNHSHGNPTLALTNLSGTTASNSAGLTLSLSAGAGGAGDGGNILAAGTRTANSTVSVLFSNENGISFGLNAVTGSIMTASHNALTTAAASDHSHGNPTLALTNLSGTTASASNGLTLSLSAAAPGGGGAVTISRFDFMLGEPMAGTTSLTVAGSSVFVEPILLPFNISASYLRIPISAGFGSSTFASTANTTVSLNQSITQFFCIYSQGVGASSKSIQSAYSSSVSMALNVEYRVGAASNNQSCSHRITHPVSGASSTLFSTSYAPAASTILRVSTTHLTAFTGPIFLDIPYASLIAPGAYWIAFQSSSATAVTGVAGMSNLTSRGSYICISQISSNIREMGANTSVGSNMFQGDGHGWWTTNTNGATTASMALSHISTIANQPLMPFRMDRHA